MANIIWNNKMHNGQRMWMECKDEEDPDFTVIIPIVMVDVDTCTVYYHPEDAQEPIYKPFFHGICFWDRKPADHEREHYGDDEIDPEECEKEDEWVALGDWKEGEE